MLTFTASLVCSPSFAQTKRDARKPVAPVATTVAQEQDFGYATSSAKFGLGVASASQLTGAQSSLTGVMELDPNTTIQALLSMPSTSPFEFSLGGLFKYTVAGSPNVGFHIGGGLTLGALSNPVTGDSAFALGIAGIGGLHFPLTSSRQVMLHLDGGPAFSLIDGEADFAIGALSGLLGVSVLYMF
ncbi:MAG: hypothetical protein NDJ90_14300 [Oligoflexia bacterium]|nr:hypothetical protein [Oligoflexia bacterium]